MAMKSHSMTIKSIEMSTICRGLDGLGRGCPGSPWSHRLRGLQHHIHLAHRAQAAGLLGTHKFYGLW